MSLRKETDQHSHIQRNSWPSFSSFSPPSLRCLSSLSDFSPTNFKLHHDFFPFNPSGLSFPHAIWPPCPNSDTLIFKSSLAFGYQMEGDYSWIVLIMPDKLLHTQKWFSKFASTFRLWCINRCAVLLDVKSFYHLVPSKIKPKTFYIDPGFLSYITDFTSGRKTWTNYLNNSFHSVFIVTRFARLFSQSCEWGQKLGEWKLKWATISAL